MSPPFPPTGVGAVVIGRNEGERLVRCLESLGALTGALVYVDSSSSDGSPQRAKQLGADVVALSLDKPFTAGRARNVGFRRLTALHPALRYVQFVDGDCEIAPGWLEFAVDFLDRHPEVAIVCGRRKERHPEASIYNQVCDIEWDTPIGEAQASGGDFLVRASVFAEVGGFADALIAGEEPEMCYRMRRRGWRIHRADRLMTLHDAAMTRFAQWAKRSSRAGYAYAARAALHWRDGTRYCWRENLRILAWGFAIPAVIIALAVLASPWFAALFLLYPLNLLRVIRDFRARRPGTPSLAYSFFVVLGKWPEFYGQLLFLLRSLRGQEQRIIEYK
jgi:GT2 family glycosyltransferase